MESFNINTKFAIGDNIYFITKTENKMKSNFSIKVDGPFPITTIKCDVTMKTTMSPTADLVSEKVYDVRYVIQKGGTSKEVSENDALTKDEASVKANSYISDLMSE